MSGTKQANAQQEEEERKIEGKEAEETKMNETRERIWSTSSNWIVITTNGMLNKQGNAIMGKGIALAAKTQVKGCDVTLGKMIKRSGNHVYMFADYGATQKLISFPTKHDWRKPSDIELIKQSCQELLALWRKQDKKTKVSLPQVGCQNGGLDYDTTVKPILMHYFATNETRPWFTVCLSNHSPS